MEQSEPLLANIHLQKPIKWIIPDTIRTDHATHLIVQQQGSEFTLLFFEVQAPLFSGTPEEQLEAYKAMEFTEAKCIARIVMSPENTNVAVNNLITSFNQYNTQLQMLQQAMKGQGDASNESSEPTEASRATESDSTIHTNTNA